jgi:hypothetical protein
VRGPRKPRTCRGDAAPYAHRNSSARGRKRLLGKFRGCAEGYERAIANQEPGLKIGKMRHARLLDVVRQLRAGKPTEIDEQIEINEASVPARATSVLRISVNRDREGARRRARAPAAARGAAGPARVGTAATRALDVRGKIDSSGQITFAGHTGDHLSCLSTCAFADEARQMPGSEVATPSGGAWSGKADPHSWVPSLVDEHERDLHDHRGLRFTPLVNRGRASPSTINSPAAGPDIEEQADSKQRAVAGRSIRRRW